MSAAVRDPLAGSAWSAAATVDGFAQSPPNDVLMQFATFRRTVDGAAIAVDIGCGAGRNAVPLAVRGWRVTGTDYSWPMLVAARARAAAAGVRVDLALAPMQALPVASRSADLVIAHGIWNLASTGQEFRAAVREAARIARPGGTLFVFTFSRNTLPASARPVDGERFVFTQFAGRPQCFLTEAELVAEMREAGFEPDDRVALSEYNRPPGGGVRIGGPPVIFEAAFRRID